MENSQLKKTLQLAETLLGETFLLWLMYKRKWLF